MGIASGPAKCCSSTAESSGTLIPGSRKQKELRPTRLERIADVYRQFKHTAAPSEVPGFCSVAGFDAIRRYGYAITPGRYVGATVLDEGDESIEERIKRLTVILRLQNLKREQSSVLRSSNVWMGLNMQADGPNGRLGDFVSLQRGTTYKSRLLGLPGPVLLGLASIQRNGGFRDDSLQTYGGAPSKLVLESGDLYVSLKDVTQSADHLAPPWHACPTVFVGASRKTQ